MASLRDIRKRIHSVENIRQLTKAIEMVAASHLHHALARLKYALRYIIKIKRILDSLTLSLKDFKHPLLEKREVKKTGLVIVSADLGLNGSYNKDIFAAANRFLENYQTDQIELILIGRKAIEHYHHSQWTICHQIPDMEEMRKFSEMQAMTHQLVDWFLTKKLDEIWVVYTRYFTMFSRQVMIKKFLSVEKPKHPKKSIGLNYILEPSPAEVYEEIITRYCLARIRLFLDQAYASELSARVLAMKTATKNANEMVDKLTLVRNKVRQADITKEMLEIISGAESLN